MKETDKTERKKKLWVVTELYYPEETSTGYYLTQIAEGLTEDFTVSVICGQPNYSGRGIRAPKKEICKNVTIFRPFGTTLDKNVILYRLINMITLSLSTFWKALFNFRKGDKILVVTAPPSLPFITAVAGLVRGASYVLLIHDKYPEILVAVGTLSENSLFARILDFFNRWLYKHTAKIIVVGRDMHELVEKKTLGLDIPIDYIPNWADLEQLEPQPREENRLLRELDLSEKFVFLYAGNMGPPHDLESIIECAEKLKTDEHFHFIFLGAGVKRKWLEREVSERNLKNVTVLAPKPRKEQIDFLNACDVAIVSLVGKMRGVAMPSRTYNILAVGKPILALVDANSEVARVIEEEHVGWTVSPNDPEELFRTIRKIYADSEILAELGENSRRAALEKYSLAAALEKYKNSLR